MKTRSFLFSLVSLFTAACFAGAQNTHQSSTRNVPGKAGIKPIGNWQVDPAETQEINQDFADASAAGNSVAPGPASGAQHHAINNALRNELESFLIAHPASAYAPSLHLWLGNRAQLVCGYSLATQHFQAAVQALAGSPDPTAGQMLLQASGSLAKLLALTGRLSDLDQLEAAVTPPGGNLLPGIEWSWAREVRSYMRKHPDEAYKCGLYCLDQLGRATQPGQFAPANITETIGSTNGFTAAELLSVAGKAGLRVRAAMITDTNNIPVPSIVHLRSEHFVFVREQRGAFYRVLDPVAFGPRWLTIGEILDEATGCVIVSDAVPPSGASTLVALDATSTGSYRGRCHFPLPSDHDDHGCPGSGGPPGSNNSNNSNAANSSNSNSNSNPSGPPNLNTPHPHRR